jgi:hypothetical protein
VLAQEARDGVRFAHTPPHNDFPFCHVTLAVNGSAVSLTPMKSALRARIL